MFGGDRMDLGGVGGLGGVSELCVGGLGGKVCGRSSRASNLAFLGGVGSLRYPTRSEQWICLCS